MKLIYLVLTLSFTSCATSGSDGNINFYSRTNECVAECKHKYGLELDWIGGATGHCYCK